LSIKKDQQSLKTYESSSSEISKLAYKFPEEKFKLYSSNLQLEVKIPSIQIEMLDPKNTPEFIINNLEIIKKIGSGASGKVIYK